MTSDHFHVGVAEHDRGQTLIVHAGNRGTERVVPPAGEKYAYDRVLWARTVEITVSPTGRSVRVFVDGDEVAGEAS